MKALGYLIGTRLKNSLKSLVRHPIRLIYVLILLAAMGFTVFAGEIDSDPNRQLRDIRELIAGAGGLFTLMFLILVKNGFGVGGTMYTMPDVNLLFPAPFRQRSVLIYGLIRQAGSSMILGFFMLFQYTWMHELFDVGYGFLVILVLAYGLSVFFGQFLAMVIYALTSADERRKRFAKIIYIGYILLLLVYAAIMALRSSDGWVVGLVDAANSMLFLMTPVSGWLTLLLTGILQGVLSDILLGLGLIVLLGAFLFWFLERVQSDFYEDVIKTAEVSQSAINASRQGTAPEATPGKVKVGKTGFTAGWGASVFYEKHKLENRRSRIFLLDTVSLIWVACVIVFALFMRETGLVPVFVMATYFQFFSVAMGRFNRELTKPYLYLLPEPPFLKMLHALRESLPTAILEAVLMFVPLYFILDISVLELFFCILARISFTMLFIAGNVVIMRVWHGKSSKVLTMMLYFVVMLLLIAPGLLLTIMGIALSQVFGFALFSEMALAFLILTISNIVLALLALFLCRNMLQYAELNEQ